MALAGERWHHLNRPMQSSTVSTSLCGVGLIATTLALVGCGATGLDWVGEGHIETGGERASQTSTLNERWVGPASIPAPAEPPSEEADARPRLNRTITLGEVDVTPVTARAAAPTEAGVSVTINNYNTVNATPAYGYGYASVGYARATPAYAAGSAPRSAAPSGPQPGQNWPTIADHGSSFPYRSAPASPWARTQ